MSALYVYFSWWVGVGGLQVLEVFRKLDAALREMLGGADVCVCVQELEKKRLLDQTDLDINQLNNWFINQRKRHWNGKGPS
jgi:hypothetical protein